MPSRTTRAPPANSAGRFFPALVIFLCQSGKRSTRPPCSNTLQPSPSSAAAPPNTPNNAKKINEIYNSLHNEVDIVSYDSFAVLRGDRIPPHVKDGREMVDAVAAWALPSTLSLIPADVLLAAVGALMCEYQVSGVCWRQTGTYIAIKT